jgi:trans-cinnamate 4-monooxygenase
MAMAMAMEQLLIRISSSSMELLLLLLLSLLAMAAAGVFIFQQLGKPKLRLPPGPMAVPIFGNWLQIGDDLNHKNLSELAKRYGDIFLLRMGRRNVVVVSSAELAREVLHVQGAEFGSRPRNVVFDLFTGNGQDMVFTVYGDHWRKMRRIMTVPFFTNKVVQQSRSFWEEEVDLAIADLKANPQASTSGVVIRRRLQMLMYNNMYRMMFGRRFEREDDPLFVELKRLNGERSQLAQSFDYNFGDFIPILRPFLRPYLQRCRKVKDERLKLFKDNFLDVRK